MSYKSKYIFIYHLGHILKCKKASQIAAYGQFNSLDTLIFFVVGQNHNQNPNVLQ